MGFKEKAMYAVKKVNLCIYCKETFPNAYDLMAHKDKEHHAELMESLGIKKKKT